MLDDFKARRNTATDRLGTIEEMLDDYAATYGAYGEQLDTLQSRTTDLLSVGEFGPISRMD